MDEGLGALIGVGLAIAFVVWLVGMILKGLAWTFLALTSLFGHPAVVLLLAIGIGAAVGLVRHRADHRAFIARSTDDFATIGMVRMTPEQWAALVVALFILFFGLFGIARS